MSMFYEGENPFMPQPNIMMDPGFYNMGMQNIQQQSQQNMVDLDISKLPKVVNPEQNSVDINVFSDYHNKVNSQPRNAPEQIDIKFTGDANFDEEKLFESLLNHTSLSDNELRNLIYYNFRFLLQKIFDNREPGNNKYIKLVGLFTDTRVLQILGEIIYRTPLSTEEKIYCNKLVYDYLKYSKTTSNCEGTINAMNTFASIVNRDIIPRLTEFGYDEKTANDIAMSSRSSLDKIKNVKRLNKIIINLPDNLITENLITATYYTVFNSATAIMEGIMFDIQDMSKLSESQKENYALINLALLSILNNMDDSKLLTILLNFKDDKALLYPDRQIRFNLRSFAPEDYPRLDYAIKRLDISNGAPLIYY